MDSATLETRGFYPADIELRQKGRELSGSFPYGRQATISDRGRVRKERFAPGAFDFAVQDETREIHLLFGHSYDKPLAVRSGRSLVLESNAERLVFRALLPVEGEQPSYMRDVLLQLRAGLIGGISPGFRVPPSSAVANAEELIDEPGNPGVQIRVINAAVLYELSLVARPAYDETNVDVRSAVQPISNSPRPGIGTLWL